jgi:NADH-quinone oxidoreductase subunit M
MLAPSHRFRGFLSALELLRAHPLGPLPLALVPFAALLWLLTVLVTPASRLNEASLARTAMVCLLTMGSFLTASPRLLLLLWGGTAAIYVAGHDEPRFERASRVATVLMGLSTVLLGAGVFLAAWERRLGATAPWGCGLILASALVRQGIFPFHAWIPEIFDHGRIGPATMFSAPQLGTYVALTLALPHASPGMLRTAAILGLITALYGALLALYQSDARRACGYLFVSQSALVFAGLDLPSREALVGSLILWVSSGLALAGLSRCVLVLEARRGRLSLDRFHGGYERMPVLAVSFLILGLAITGFPATLGFVGEEMLVRGAVDTFPTLGLSVVASGALTGLAVMRMYFSLFCGRRDTGAHLNLLRSEGFGFGIAALLLLGLGLAPTRLVHLLDRAGAAAMEGRGDPGR